MTIHTPSRPMDDDGWSSMLSMVPFNPIFKSFSWRAYLSLGSHLKAYEFLGVPAQKAPCSDEKRPWRAQGTPGGQRKSATSSKAREFEKFASSKGLKAWEFEGSKVWKREHSQLKQFEGLSVWAFEGLKAWEFDSPTQYSLLSGWIIKWMDYQLDGWLSGWGNFRP